MTTLPNPLAQTQLDEEKTKLSVEVGKSWIDKHPKNLGRLAAKLSKVEKPITYQESKEDLGRPSDREIEVAVANFMATGIDTKAVSNLPRPIPVSELQQPVQAAEQPREMARV